MDKNGRNVFEKWHSKSEVRKGTERHSTNNDLKKGRRLYLLFKKSIHYGVSRRRCLLLSGWWYSKKAIHDKGIIEGKTMQWYPNLTIRWMIEKSIQLLYLIQREYFGKECCWHSYIRWWRLAAPWLQKETCNKIFSDVTFVKKVKEWNKSLMDMVMTPKTTRRR